MIEKQLPDTMPFNRSEWIANYMYHGGETVCRVMQEIDSQVEQILEKNKLVGIVTCTTRFEGISEHSMIPIYGRNIQDSSNFFKPQAIKYLDALIIVYGERKLQTLMTRVADINNELLKKIFVKLKYKFLGDICIISFSALESKLINDLFGGIIKTSQEEGYLNEIMLQVNNMLGEYDISLGMVIPGWEKFRPKDKEEADK